jgi:hypothetical protein
MEGLARRRYLDQRQERLPAQVTRNSVQQSMCRVETFPFS